MFRRMTALLLTLAIAALGLPAAAETVCQPGDTFLAVFEVTANPNRAKTVLLRLSYDHDALRMPGDGDDDFESDQCLLSVPRKNGVAAGTRLQALFEVPDGARPGYYAIRADVVEAYDQAGQTVGGMTLSSTGLRVLTGLEPVTGLAVTDIRRDAVALSWNATPDAASYEVSYTAAGGGGTGTLTVEEPAARITGLEPATLYTVSVRAVHGKITSAPFAMAVMTAAPARPAISAGDTVTFGAYPQTEAGNDRTPIVWTALEVRDGKALLLSRYGLDVQPYNTEIQEVTWETCTLRTWLNGEFLDTAFSAEEQSAIVKTNVDNGQSQGYPEWRTNGGNNTQDRIFLLSCAEADKYFGVTLDANNDNTKSRIAPTAYAAGRGAYTRDSYKTTDGGAAGWWWLRSPGSRLNNAAYVNNGGSLTNYSVRLDTGCVRPAVWVDLGSGLF